MRTTDKIINSACENQGIPANVATEAVRKSPKKNILIKTVALYESLGFGLSNVFIYPVSGTFCLAFKGILENGLEEIIEVNV